VAKVTNTSAGVGIKTRKV